MTRYLIMLFIVLGIAIDDTLAQSDSLVANPPFDFSVPVPPSFPDREFAITNYGAVLDSEAMNTGAFRRAIEACHTAGGGMVVVPAGVWLTGPIHLKSNVRLHLADSLIIRFNENFSDYLPVVLIQRGGFFCYNYSPPIYANEVENVAITGQGTIDGQGQTWWPWKKNQPGMVELFQMGKQNIPIEERVFGTEEAGVRPPFVQFINAKNVWIQGVRFINSPSWSIHPVFCENVRIENISVVSHGPNNDGIDIDGCRNVLIQNCLLDVGDDNICLKSGRDEEAWRIGKVCENIVVRNCIARAGHGGFVIGSEMSAGVRNVLVENCHFSGTKRGIRFKSRVGRGGVVQNVWIKNITMENIQEEAIIGNLQYDAEPIERNMQYQKTESNKLEYAPVFRDIFIDSITCRGASQAIKLVGLPGNYLYDWTLSNIFIEADEGLELTDGRNIHFESINLHLPETIGDTSADK